MFSFYEPLYSPIVPETCLPRDSCGLQQMDGETFQAFLDFCFGHAKYFCLSWEKWERRRNGRVLRELEPFLAHKLLVNRWFYIQNRELNVYLYHANEASSRVLRRWYPDLFLRGYRGKQKRMPKNLCFFDEKRLFMGSISHLLICWVYPPEEGREGELKRFGGWIEKRDIHDARVELKDFIPM